ncbi:FtsX-like permease family protein [Bacteroidia bacterium]|nr:FtsX-like permease family protein [Bacteroidia bacterium]MDC3406407.1 FtsX-like permease family protein [Bacteroidia bacterium]
MRLSLFIAYRYLFSKKKINAINIITGIAMLGFGVGSFAMIIVLSTFNGFENIVESMINNYDPDIKITAKGEKTFKLHSSLENQLNKIEAIDYYTPVLEEKVVIKYDQHQEIARIKGIDSKAPHNTLDSIVVLGEFYLGDSLKNFGVFGAGLAQKLNLFPGSPELVTVFVPRRDVAYSALNPTASLSTEYLRSSGTFTVHEEVDNEVFMTRLDFAQKLLSYPNAISALEVSLKAGEDPIEAKENLIKVLGDDWEVKTRRELNEVLYKIFSSEKWFTYAILSLVLFISSFNIFGSLIMLVIDKKKDIGILKSMGAEEGTLFWVFLWQGTYIALIGGGIGILCSILLVWSQSYFEWFALENAIVSAYPVDLLWSDVTLTVLTILFLGSSISLYPAFKASKTPINAIN